MLELLHDPPLLLVILLQALLVVRPWHPNQVEPRITAAGLQMRTLLEYEYHQNIPERSLLADNNLTVRYRLCRRQSAKNLQRNSTRGRFSDSDHFFQKAMLAARPLGQRDHFGIT